MSQTEPPAICAYSACEETVVNPATCLSCGTAYCSASCYVLGNFEHPPTCAALAVPIDPIEEGMRMYANRHEPILGKLAVAMAGCYSPRNGWGNHRVLVVHLKDAEGGGRRRYVHSRLEVEHFFEVIESFGLAEELEGLARLSLLGVAIFLVYASPSRRPYFVGHTLPIRDGAVEAGPGYDVVAGIEALRDEMFWREHGLVTRAQHGLGGCGRSLSNRLAATDPKKIVYGGFVGASAMCRKMCPGCRGGFGQGRLRIVADGCCFNWSRQLRVVTDGDGCQAGWPFSEFCGGGGRWDTGGMAVAADCLDSQAARLAQEGV
ncbi:hypothetical protein BD779DRAFT_1469536 [Infundibulicybe gibba]|nr:hypothetical protein BD779DRAFT_1469536 [Infundibulicybe gibba]